MAGPHQAVPPAPPHRSFRSGRRGHPHLWQPHRHLLLGGSALVSIARLRARLLEVARPRVGIFAASAVATFLFLFGVFSAFRRAHASDLPEHHSIFVGGNEVKLPVAPVLRLIALAVIALIALATAAAMQAQWTTLALYWYAPQAAAGSPGTSQTPSSAVPSTSTSSRCPPGSSSPAGCSRSPFSPASSPSCFCSSPAAHAPLAAAFPAASPYPGAESPSPSAFSSLVLALREYISRFELLFEHHTIFDGVSYTDAHVTLTGMLFIVRGARSGRAHRRGHRHCQPARPLAHRRRSTRHPLLRRHRRGRLVCDQLPGQAQ